MDAAGRVIVIGFWIRKTQGRIDSDKVDQAVAGAKLGQSKLVKPSFDCAAQNIAVEDNRAFDVGDSKNDMIEADRHNRIT